MPQCFVKSCGNYYSKTRKQHKVIYHMFPADPEIARKWVLASGHAEDIVPPFYTRICSDHFSVDCYQRDLQHELLGLPLRKKLKVNAVPNEKLPKRVRFDAATCWSHCERFADKLKFMTKLRLIYQRTAAGAKMDRLVEGVSESR